MDYSQIILIPRERAKLFLKRFIKATVAFIECELSFTNAFDFLNNPQG